MFRIVLADPPVHQHRRIWDISPPHSCWQGRFPQPLQAVGLCWGIWGGGKKTSETKLLVGVIQFHSFSCMDSDGQRFQGKQGCLGTNEWPSHTLDVELCTRDWWVTSGTGTRGCCHSLWIQGISSCVWPDNSHGQEGRGRSWMGGIDGGRF